MSKSIDLREAAVAYHEAGHTLSETAKVFQVGKSTISAWTKKKRETGNLNNKPLNRTFKKIDPEKICKRASRCNPAGNGRGIWML